MPLNDAHFGGHTRKAPTMTAALAWSSWGPFCVPGARRRPRFVGREIAPAHLG
nr:MAG TPA: hypothetical protein [Caudoviricetes sp.]